jgi:membrane associated rhomboid family serine protease
MAAVSARLTPTIKKIVIVQATIFGLYLLAPAASSLLSHLELGPNVFRGEPWQVVTGLAVELKPLNFVFQLVGLWFTGAMVERSLGTRRFLVLFLGAGILANLAIAGVGHLTGGAYGDVGCWLAVHALFVAFARIFDRQEVSVVPGLVVRARHVGMFWVAFALLVSLLQRSAPFVAGVVVATPPAVQGARRRRPEAVQGPLAEVLELSRGRFAALAAFSWAGTRVKLAVPMK